MKKIILLAVLSISSFIVNAADLPNPLITSGATDLSVINNIPFETLCTKGFTSGFYDANGTWQHAPAKSTKVPSDWKPVRNVSEAEKLFTYHAYRMKANDRSICSEGYEIDHLCSLELGCNNVAKNRWPQSYCGQWNAHMKDQLENRLHSLVCKSKMSLKDAQQCISTDWTACYNKVMK